MQYMFHVITFGNLAGRNHYSKWFEGVGPTRLEQSYRWKVAIDIELLEVLS